MAAPYKTSSVDKEGQMRVRTDGWPLAAQACVLDQVTFTPRF